MGLLQRRHAPWLALGGGRSSPGASRPSSHRRVGRSPHRFPSSGSDAAKMKRRVAALLLALVPFAAGAAPRVAVYFSPGSSCTDAIVREIAVAKSSIHGQAYSFTSEHIARALVEAEKRGVKVVAILDASNRTKNYSAADFLAHEGIETYIDSQHAIAHNKIIIIDETTVITGSFNFTKAADQKNAENLLVIPDPDLAAKYEANWQEHFAHAEYYAGR